MRFCVHIILHNEFCMNCLFHKQSFTVAHVVVMTVVSYKVEITFVKACHLSHCRLEFRSNTGPCCLLARARTLCLYLVVIPAHS